MGPLLVIPESKVLDAITRNAMKNLQVSLEERLHQRFKIVAADRGETLANLIRQAIAQFVERHERQAQIKEGHQP